MADLREKVNLSIVLPCYNPLPNWSSTIVGAMQELQDVLPHVVFQLIIVNDGSTTAIAPEAVAAIEAAVEDFQYISYAENRGKGYALRQGMQAVRHELCIYTDIDFPYTTQSFLALFERLQNPDLDIVVGVRDAQYYEHVPAFRKFISKFLRFFIKLLLRIKITDTQCGIKGFNAAGRSTFLKTEIDRYLFDLEFVFLSSNASNLTIVSLPVTLKPEIVFSKVNMKILLTEGRSFLKLFFKSLFGLQSNKS